MTYEYTPSPEEIKRETAAIKENWTAKERARRHVSSRKAREQLYAPYTIPIVSFDSSRIDDHQPDLFDEE